MTNSEKCEFIVHKKMRKPYLKGKSYASSAVFPQSMSFLSLPKDKLYFLLNFFSISTQLAGFPISSCPPHAQ